MLRSGRISRSVETTQKMQHNRPDVLFFDTYIASVLYIDAHMRIAITRI